MCLAILSVQNLSCPNGLVMINGRNPAQSVTKITQYAGRAHRVSTHNGVDKKGKTRHAYHGSSGLGPTPRLYQRTACDSLLREERTTRRGSFAYCPHTSELSAISHFCMSPVANRKRSTVDTEKGTAQAGAPLSVDSVPYSADPRSPSVAGCHELPAGTKIRLKSAQPGPSPPHRTYPAHGERESSCRRWDEGRRRQS
jgi:hypothetical protein